MKVWILFLIMSVTMVSAACPEETQIALERESMNIAEVIYSGDMSLADEILKSMNPYMDPGRWVFATCTRVSPSWDPREDLASTMGKESQLPFHDWLQACYQIEHGFQQLGGDVQNFSEAKKQLAVESATILRAEDERAYWRNIANSYIEGGPRGYAMYHQRRLLAKVVQTWSTCPVDVVDAETEVRGTGFYVIRVTAVEKSGVTHELNFGWTMESVRWEWEILDGPVQTDRTPSLILYGTDTVDRLGDDNVLDISPYFEIVPTGESDN